MTTVTNGDNTITELLLNKYNTLNNSVPTGDAELSNINDTHLNTLKG